MAQEKNTCWEDFDIEGQRYRRQYFQGLHWYYFELNGVGKPIMRSVTDSDRINELEEMYQEFINIEHREFKLKRILNYD